MTRYLVVTQSTPGTQSLYLAARDTFGFEYGTPQWWLTPLFCQGFSSLATARAMADRMNDRFHAGDNAVPAPVTVCCG